MKNNNNDKPKQEPAPSNQPESAAPGSKYHCDYCGAKLNPRLYYCLQCSRPYKHFETTLPREKPLQLTGDELILKSAPQVWTLFWTYVAILIGSVFVANKLFVEVTTDLQLYVTDSFLLVATIVFAMKYWPTLLPQFKNFGFFNWYAWLAILALPPVLGLNYIYHSGAQKFFGSEGTDFFSELRETGVTEITVIFFFCVFPAIIEEISFRGLMQTWLKDAIGSKWALLLASALFAGLHFNPISFFYLFLVGLLLGWAKLKTKSLYPSIFIHFSHNFIVIKYMT